MKGAQGIDHLSILVVKGTVVKKENDPNVTIVAEGIYVEKGPPKLPNADSKNKGWLSPDFLGKKFGDFIFSLQVFISTSIFRIASS